MKPSQKTGLSINRKQLDTAYPFHSRGNTVEKPSINPSGSTPGSAHRFATAQLKGVYQAIFQRRDVRGQFLPDAIPDAVLSRVLMAAHYAPSVGFMQPWNFLLIDAPAKKQQIRDLFDHANGEAAEMFDGDKRAIYKTVKLEGIVESPLNICITCDKDRAGPVVVGRTHIPTMDLYSSVCAVQNLWLAARGEGLGVGWVSIFHEQALKDALGLPDNVTPVAYLCIGYVSHFHERPELEKAQWRQRLPIEKLVSMNGWNQPPDAQQSTLVRQLKADQARVQDSADLSALQADFVD